MVSLFLFIAALFCMVLNFVWPAPVIPPLNRKYRDWDDDPAQQRFARQMHWFYVITGAFSIIASALIFASIKLALGMI